MTKEEIQKENLNVLTKSLQETKGKALVKTDFREMRIVYLCGADKENESLCKHYSPASDESCNRKDYSKELPLCCLGIN